MSPNYYIFEDYNNINIKRPHTLSDKKINSPRITCKTIKTSDELIEVNLKIPIIKGLDSLEIEEKLNSIFKKDIMSFKNEIEEMAKEYADEADKFGISKIPYNAFTDYCISYNKNNILSIYITYYQYTGGAHGLSIRKAYNINTSNGNLLSLAGMFKDTSNYKSIINKEIQAQINKNKEMYFPDSFIGISKNENFYLEGNYIIIFFQQYEIAPYAAGIPEFKIPINCFKSTINFM
jgi:hypothetical protein